jgi:predicted DNA-binding WGR domain protein
MHGAVVLDQVVDELAALAGGAGLVLELVDRGPGPGRRARFYALHLQPALWGGVDVVRAWGRLGHRHRPRCLITSHPDESSAHAALRGLVRRRLRRGYLRSTGGGAAVPLGGPPALSPGQGGHARCPRTTSGDPPTARRSAGG